MRVWTVHVQPIPATGTAGRWRVEPLLSTPPLPGL